MLDRRTHPDPKLSPDSGYAGRFSELAGQSLVGTYLIQEDRFLYVNPAFAQIFGYEQQEVIDRLTLAEIAEGPDRRLVAENVRRRLQGEIQDVRYVFRGRHRDRRELYVEVHGWRTEHEGQPALSGVLVDVTEREQAARALREERNFIEAAFATVASLVVVLDRHGRIVRFNRACERTTGYTAEEVGGRFFWDIVIPDEELAEVKAVFDGLIAGDFPNENVNTWKTKQNDLRIIRWRNTALTDEQGEVTHIIATGADLTERREIERRLHESELMAQSILSTAVDGIITIDERGRIESFNPAARQIFGYRAEEVIGQNVKVLMPPPYRDEHDGYMERYKRTGVRRIIGSGRQVRGRRKDGTTFPMELAVSEVKMENQRFFTGLVRDISERRDLEKQVLHAAEKERQRLGRDLHDILGLQLTNAVVMADLIATKLDYGEELEPEDVLRIKRMVMSGAEKARNLAHNLQANRIDENGLAAALQETAATLQATNFLEARFEADGTLPEIGQEASTQLFRIVQEAVNNVIKHSEANEIAIVLRRHKSNLILSVLDDGIGLPDDFDGESGIGMETMQYRARAIGAELSVHDRPEGGTEVRCVLPLAPAA